LPEDSNALAEAATASRSFLLEEYQELRRRQEEGKTNLQREMTVLAEGLIRHGLPRTEVDSLLGLYSDTTIISLLERLRLNRMDRFVSSTKLDDTAVRAIRAAVQNDESLKDTVRRVRALIQMTYDFGNRYRKFSRVLSTIVDARDKHSSYLLEQGEILTEIDRLASRYETRFFWLSRTRKLSRYIADAIGLAKQAKDVKDIVGLLGKIS